MAASKGEEQTKEKTLYSWKAGSRPFKPRDRETYIKIVSVASLFGLILFIVQGIMPVLLIVSLLFLFYVMSTVKPETIEYKITNFGIRISGALTPWDNMTRFWFTERMGSKLLVIETTNLPGRTELVINSQDEKKIKKEMSEYLLHEKASPSFFDKSAEFISKRLPIE